MSIRWRIHHGTVKIRGDAVFVSVKKIEKELKAVCGRLGSANCVDCGRIMAKYRYFECPDCSGTFKWLMHPEDEPPPNFCPLCGSQMSAEPSTTFVPMAPHLAKTIGKSADQVYRQMEEA